MTAKPRTEVDKESAKVRGMFAGIAHRYDLLNHVLSLNIDKSWRRRTARALELGPEERVLDACTGTADLALELAGYLDLARGGRVIGTDFTQEMVERGEAKRRRLSEERCRLLVADTLHLPFADATFDAASVAFGIRNVCDLDAGLSELARVLRPAGRLAILEFTTPRGRLFRKVYEAYFHRVLPRVGRWISRGKQKSSNAPSTTSADVAYSYLPASVSSFPGPDALAARLESAGFDSVRYETLTGGIAALHLARKRISQGRTPIEPADR